MLTTTSAMRIVVNKPKDVFLPIAQLERLPDMLAFGYEADRLGKCGELVTASPAQQDAVDRRRMVEEIEAGSRSSSAT